MGRSQRILWGEGMFLRPQHFQQHSLFIEAGIAQALRQIHGHPWGVRRVEVNAEALQGGLLRISRLEAVFQDGTAVDAPAVAPLPQERNLADIPQLGTQTVVYACLPTLNAYGGNSADGTGATRYRVERAMVADLYTDALEAEVACLHPNVRLLLAEENRDGHLCLPIARLARNAGGAWEQDHSFVPPLVDIGGSSHLQMQARRLLDILAVKSQALAASHRERVKSLVEYGTSDIASFWLLHTVNRAYPLLRHHAALPTHPEAFYAFLAAFCGELTTFSSTVTAADIPVYRHDDLTSVFDGLDTLIRELLETVVSNRYAVIPLTNTKPSFFVGRLDSERLVDKVDYYLSVAGDVPTAQVLDMVPLKLKAGSPDDVEKILNSALPGVRLVHAAQTPTALPVRVGNHYFILEPQGQIFERMKQSRSICIYVPQALLDLKLELIAVFR